MDNTFGENFQGSAVANLITGSVFLLLYILKDRCSHSSCRGNSKFCKYNCKDIDDNSGDKECVLEEIKIIMQEMHGKLNKDIFPEHNEAVSLSSQRRGSTSKCEVA